MLQLEETKRNKNESTNSILRHFIRTDFLYKTKYAQYLSYDVISKLLRIEIFCFSFSHAFFNKIKV